MYSAKSILSLMCGVITGIVLVISCGDNFRIQSDAANDTPMIDAVPTCDCPITEAPLAGRFVVVSQLQVVPANNSTGQGALCPLGSHVISGSCTTDVPNPVRNVTLQQSGAYDMPPSAWHCEFQNHEDTPVTIRVSVLCLKPPA